MEGMNDTHAAAHVGESLLRSLYPALSHTDGEGSRDVWTELYRDTDRLKHEQWNHDLSETLCVTQAYALFILSVTFYSA